MCLNTKSDRFIFEADVSRTNPEGQNYENEL